MAETTTCRRRRRPAAQDERLERFTCGLIELALLDGNWLAADVLLRMCGKSIAEQRSIMTETVRDVRHVIAAVEALGLSEEELARRAA